MIKTVVIDTGLNIIEDQKESAYIYVRPHIRTSGFGAFESDDSQYARATLR